MSLDHAILGFLSERPRSGYDLKTRCFDVTSRGFWSADQAQIYRTLDRLQSSKLVSSRRLRQSGKPDRRVYELTHTGREALAEWASRPQPLPAARDAFLVQLFFSGVVTDDALLGVLHARRAEHQCQLDDLRDQSVETSRDHTIPPREAVVRGFAIDGAIAQHRALIDWLDDCIESVSDGALPGSGATAGQRQLFGLEGA